MQANSSRIKKILGLVREGDYAHPGEEEAIDLVFSSLAKNKNQVMLDVGCGLGGTAHYLQQQGFGKVIGVDIDIEAIAYAKNKYPDLEFYNAEAANISAVIKPPVDIIYMFNAFYAFSDKNKALLEFGKLASANAWLIIFDYTAPPFSTQLRKAVRIAGKPLNLAMIESEFMQAGWRIQKIMELNAEYRRWYSNFAQKIISKKTQILSADGEEAYQFVWQKYSDILSDIDNNLLSGAIIYAQKVV